MATYTVDKIEYSSNVYVLQDSGALQLTGGQVTGPVTFGDTITVDNATISSLVVNGNASFTNNIQANTINGVTVGSSPKFTDTNTEVSTLTLASGSTAGTTLTYGGKYTLTAGSKTVSFTMPASDNTNTTYSLSGALSSHKFTSTLTAGGSGSGTSTSDFTLAAGTGITITDDTSARKMTIACSVTNTDTKVTQTTSTSSTEIPVLLRDNKNASTDSGTADASRFTSTVTVQPSSGNLKATKFNGYTLAAACAKAVDTSIASGSTSANLPTSAAVATYVTSNATKAQIVRWSE